MNSALAQSPYTFKEKVARILWATVQHLLFRTSFHNWYRWRRLLLSLFGAKLDPVVRIRRTVRVECPWNLSIGHDSTVGDRAILYCLGPVRIGSRTTISQGAHICAGSHDYTLRSLPLLRPPIEIGDDVWICADAFVGPDVKVGDGAILGARAVAMKSLEPWTIYSGNPMKAVRQRPPFRD
jgi:putative colanic acid biosynthesis acetyltransferase WcaF